MAKQPDLPLPRRVAGPSSVAPHLDADTERFKASATMPLIYLLVDAYGAQQIRDGVVPDYVKRQAASALDWSLEDATKPAGW